jgi:xylulose-5-phosphate/fructose-6-phosphate phosphoketolase
MSANLHANGGLLHKDLDLPDFRRYAVEVPARGTVEYENTRPLGEFLRDVMQNNTRSARKHGWPTWCRRIATAGSSRATDG